MLSDDELIKQFRRDLSASRTAYREWRQEARALYEAVAGRQWDPEDEAVMREQRRPMVTFNLLDKFIDAISGLQINNRQEIRFYPRTGEDVGVNELATGAVKWCRDMSGAEDEETEAFADMILTGLGCIEHRLEDAEGPHDYVAQERVDPLEVYVDPHARRRNLVDARYIIRLKPYTLEQYVEAFGEEYELAQQLADIEDREELTGGLERVTAPDDYDDGASAPAPRRVVRVAQYQYVRLESRHIVSWQGQQQELTPEQWRRLEPELRAASIEVSVREMQRRVRYTAIICGDKVHRHGESPTQAGFTLQVITGKRDRNANTWRGIGRNLMDPNRWTNKFFSSILWQLSVNPKGGLLAERSAFEDPRKAEESWADPSRITFVEDGAITEGRLKEKPAGQYPQGMDRLMAFSLESMPAVSGLNLELLGLADRQQPGVLEAQRKQAAMAIIAWAFDAMRRYYRLSGLIMLDLIRVYLADDRLIRIIGDEGARYVPLLRDRLVGTYDVIVDEAPTSTNMRERVWAVLRDVLPIAQAAQVPIPRKVLDYMPIPDELVRAWQEELKPNPQRAELEQRMAALEQRLREVSIEREQAAAERDTAQARLNQAKAEQIAAAAPYDALAKAAEAGAAQGMRP